MWDDVAQGGTSVHPPDETPRREATRDAVKVAVVLTERRWSSVESQVECLIHVFARFSIDSAAERSPGEFTSAEISGIFVTSETSVMC